MPMKIPGYSLRFALVVYVLLPLLLIVGTAGYLGLRAFESQTEERMQKDVELVARAIRLPLSRAMERDRQGSVEQALESAFRTNRVYGAYVFDADGERLAAVGMEDPVPSRRRLSRLAEEGDRVGEYGEVAGREVYSYFVPMTNSGGQIIGLLQVTRRRSDIESYMQTVRLQGGGLLLLATGLVAGVVLFGHRGAVGRHLDRLGGSMSRVEAGDRLHRASPGGPREVAALAGALNSMLDSIARAEREIEHRRASEAALEERLRHTEKLAAIGQLAAGVAHELGTPLSVVGGRAQRVARDERLSEATRASLADIRLEVQRMEHIVRQLLDFGRQTALHRRRVRADRLARASVAAVAEDTPGTVEVSGPLPAPSFSADPFRVEQALVNLLRNALQAGPGVRVRLSWLATDGRVEFRVDDSGPGIPPESRARVFEPFFTTKQVGEGTGLGLAVVHGVVEEHGGEVHVEESPLGGARFRLAFPREEPGGGENREVA